MTISMTYMKSVIIETEIKLTLAVERALTEKALHFTASSRSRQHLKNRAFSIRAFSHIGRFRLTPNNLCWAMCDYKYDEQSTPSEQREGK